MYIYICINIELGESQFAKDLVSISRLLSEVQGTKIDEVEHACVQHPLTYPQMIILNITHFQLLNEEDCRYEQELITSLRACRRARLSAERTPYRSAGLFPLWRVTKAAGTASEVC